VQGGVVDISFENPADTGGGTSIGMNLGSCQVTTYTKANPPRQAVDEGPITISGDALKKPLGTCAFAAETKKYECSFDNGAGDIDVKIFAAPQHLYTVVLPKDYATTDLIGATVRLSGFAADQDNDATNGKQTFNGDWPIINQAAGTDTTEEVTISIGAAPLAPANPEKKAGTFKLLGGFQPGSTLFAGTKAAFLDEPGTITVKKDAKTSPGIGALNFTVAPAGKGFSTMGGTRPYEFPFATKKEVTFSCGTTCGTLPAGATTVFAISGRTTDVPLAALTGFPKDLMPPAESFITSYATFQCAYIGAKEGKLTQAAVDAILATNPTRVEIRVFEFSGQPGAANLLIGHGEVGHTDKP